MRIKAEKREEKQTKKRYGPKGGGFAAQDKRMKVSKRYEGLPRALKRQIIVKLSRKRKDLH